MEKGFKFDCDPPVLMASGSGRFQPCDLNEPEMRSSNEQTTYREEAIERLTGDLRRAEEDNKRLHARIDILRLALKSELENCF